MRIFISHSSTDKNKIEGLILGLERLKCDVFYSSKSYSNKIQFGENFYSRIKNEIKESDYILAILSESFYSSIPCQIEMGIAYAYNKLITPIGVEEKEYNKLLIGLFTSNDRLARINNEYDMIELLSLFSKETSKIVDCARYIVDKYNQFNSTTSKELEKSSVRYNKEIKYDILANEHNDTKVNQQYKISKTQEIREYIVRKLEKAQQEGKEYFEIVSGELSKEIGLFNRMPMICNAMTSLENNIKYDILYNPPKGNGATKRIRYYLHNNKSVNENGNDKKAINYNLPNSLRGRNINENIIPTVCNLKNMLHKLVQYHGDFSKLKPWEKRSYKAYNIEDIKSQIIYSPETEWVNIIRKHILDGLPSDFGASCIDIYLVAYVSETYGKGKDKFFEYVKTNNISDKPNSAQAIWQVGKGDGVYLDILNNDGAIRDWDFIKKWSHTN
ncbi:toll/interleukin-1 receptor domain-containing protein [Vallitalea guaymasensis]|uniref:toll/interleukin-1 receptor domain-containing protein n=1 Tax=Vallitalea guaymasensis TaxID=1185412 RepID=UPI000DE2BD55|nr:toll/interleukin-1 receptor domain-containing protein [Vallitalea guaymasensis]